MKKSCMSRAMGTPVSESTSHRKAAPRRTTAPIATTLRELSDRSDITTLDPFGADKRRGALIAGGHPSAQDTA